MSSFNAAVSYVGKRERDFISRRLCVYARFNELCWSRGEASGFFSRERGYLSEFARCEWIGTRYWPNRLVCHCRSWTWLRFDDADARWYADGHKKAKDEKIPGQQVGILTKHVDKIDFMRVFSNTVCRIWCIICFYLFLLFFLFVVFVIFLCFLLIVFGEIWFDFILSKIIGLVLEFYWVFETMIFWNYWNFKFFKIEDLKIEKFENGEKKRLKSLNEK